MKRIICTFVTISLILTVFPIGVLANDGVDFTAKTIPVVIDKDGTVSELSLAIIAKNDELYIEPNNLSKITRYQFSSDDNRLIYTLGLKSLLIDLSQQTLQVNFTEQPFSGTLLVNGIHYLPMSELLPWLNVECYVADNKLHIDSDIKSYWEVVSDFDSQDYLFDLADVYGGTVGDITSLCAIGVFDCILDLQNVWKRFPIGSGKIYNYEIYKECFREFALPETGTEAQIQEILTTVSQFVSDGTQRIDVVDDVFEQTDLDEKLNRLFGIDEPSSTEGWPTDTDQTVEALKLSKDALKYIKTGFLYARIAIADTTDYAEALRYIYMREGVSPQSDIIRAVSESINILESQKGAFMGAAGEMLLDMGKKMLGESADKWLKEKGIEEALGDTIFGSLGLYLDIVDVTLSQVWPINEAYSEISKMTVYQSIQYDALNAYYNIPKYYTKVSARDISNGRTSALIFLKTAKKCFEAQQGTFDLLGGEGVLDWKIKLIEDKILEFEMASLANDHDAISDKTTEVKELKELWSKEEFIHIANGDGWVVPELIGTWYLYGGGDRDNNWANIVMYYVKFCEDGTVTVASGFVKSEYTASYRGVWSAVADSTGSYRISLDVTGGKSELGEDPPSGSYSLIVKTSVCENQLQFEKISGDDISLIYSVAYELELSAATWIERQEQALN